MSLSRRQLNWRLNLATSTTRSSIGRRTLGARSFKLRKGYNCSQGWASLEVLVDRIVAWQIWVLTKEAWWKIRLSFLKVSSYPLTSWRIGVVVAAFKIERQSLVFSRIINKPEQMKPTVRPKRQRKAVRPTLHTWRHYLTRTKVW